MARDETAREPDAERSLLDRRSTLLLAETATAAVAGTGAVSADESSDDLTAVPEAAGVSDGHR